MCIQANPRPFLILSIHPSASLFFFSFNSSSSCCASAGRSLSVRAARLVPHYGIIFFDFPPESRFFSFASCTLSSPHLLHLEKSGLQLSAVATTPADAVTCTSLLGRLQRRDAALSLAHTPLTHTDLAARRRWPVRLQWHWKNSRVFLLPVVLLCYVRRRPLAQISSSRRPQLEPGRPSFSPRECRRPRAVKFQFALSDGFLGDCAQLFRNRILA
jgi:hypothetical protein